MASAEPGLSTDGGRGFYSALLDDDPQDLYENAPCAYVSSRPDGTIVKVNTTFLAWTGYERGGIIGKSRLQDLLAPGDRIFYETHVAPMLQMQGLVREIAVDLVCGGGARLPVLLNAAVRRDDDGHPSIVRTVMFDATERRAYEGELLAARRRAEEAESRARTLARTLQSTFLPPDIAPLPGLDIGSAYRPAGDGSEVGGDFYDVFETGRGAWGIVLGDVCGKGAAAAVLTALARYTVRAEALRTPYPSAVLAALHDAMVRYYPDTFCTALFLVLERSGDNAFRLTIASGGHHLPVRRSADGAMGTIGETGRIIGLLETPRLRDTTLALVPGDIVVLYTDGVIEGASPNGFFGEEGLFRAIRASASAGLGAQETADAIVGATLEFQGGTARDDIAVLVLKVPPS